MHRDRCKVVWVFMENPSTLHLPLRMKTKMFAHVKLFLSILAAIGLPFLIVMALPQAQRESVEINMAMLCFGIVFALFVGERHLHRQSKADRT